MRIGIDARFLQGPRRGQGQYVYYLIKELLALDSGNEYVAFYNGMGPQAPAFDAATPHLDQVWCDIPGTLLKHAWKLLHFPPVEYLIGRVDVFHIPTNFSFTHYGPIPSRAPMVATFNGMADPATIWEGYDDHMINEWFGRVAANASIVITISEMAKKDFLRRARFPEDRVRIVHYGVSGEFKPVHEKLAISRTLFKYGLTGKKYLLYVGAAEPNKNLNRLLNAFAAVSKTPGMEDLQLVMAGRIDDFYRRLAEMTTVLGIGQKVIFTGYVGHDDLPGLYNGSEAFILPTLNEWFGIPVLEALACGIPAAVSRNTGALDVAGGCVVTFDPGDTEDMARSIREVVMNKELRERLTYEGLRCVKGLSWAETAKKTAGIYREACAGSNRGRPAARSQERA
jgi:glycosyltransferase involved in cell wall biosynthesis